MEKKKFEKVKESLTKTEEELKDLKKVCSLRCFICWLSFKTNISIEIFYYRSPYTLFIAQDGRSCGVNYVFGKNNSLVYGSC